jgi:hypothetical protein
VERLICKLLVGQVSAYLFCQNIGKFARRRPLNPTFWQRDAIRDAVPEQCVSCHLLALTLALRTVAYAVDQKFESA